MAVSVRSILESRIYEKCRILWLLANNVYQKIMEDTMSKFEYVMKKTALLLWEFFKIMIWSTIAFCATAGVLIWRYFRKRKKALKSSNSNQIQYKDKD